MPDEQKSRRSVGFYRFEILRNAFVRMLIAIRNRSETKNNIVFWLPFGGEWKKLWEGA